MVSVRFVVLESCLYLFVDGDGKVDGKGRGTCVPLDGGESVQRVFIPDVGSLVATREYDGMYVIEDGEAVGVLVAV